MIHDGMALFQKRVANLCKQISVLARLQNYAGQSTEASVKKAVQFDEAEFAGNPVWYFRDRGASGNNSIPSAS